MSLPQTISKIKKLLALSSSPNANEAALAAAKAAALMREYQIEEASLANYDDDDLQDTKISSHLFYDSRGKRQFWKMNIAQACALICNCITYWSSDVKNNYIRIVGRQRDSQQAKYLFDMIVLQVNLSAEEAYDRTEITDSLIDKLNNISSSSVVIADDADNNDYSKEESIDDQYVTSRRAWLHAFRLGCSKTIYYRISTDYYKRLEEIKSSSSINSPDNKALVIISDRIAKVNDYAQRLGLEPIKKQSTMSDYSGYLAGIQAGETINISSKVRGYLDKGKKQLA